MDRQSPLFPLTSDHLLELAAEFRALAMNATESAVIGAFNELANQYTAIAEEAEGRMRGGPTA
jgi:hypothetical protein